MSKIQYLKKGFLFQNFTPDELEGLSRMVREQFVKAGCFVFKEQSQATSMFIIQSGSIEILKEGPSGAQLVVTQFSEGAHFGEMAFVDRSARAAGAMAKEDTRLLEVRYDDLESIVATQPAVGLKLYHSIAKTLCQRIRQTTSDLSQIFFA